MKRTHDIFLSHASEDKRGFVDKLYKKLTQAKYKVWYDKEEIKWGDKLEEKIDEGLNASAYGIVVISDNYFAANKTWTFMEFEEILTANNILPILHGIDMQTIKLKYPKEYRKIKDWYAISSDKGVDYIVHEAKKKIGNNTIENYRRIHRRPIYQPLIDGIGSLIDEIGYLIDGIGYFITHGSDGGIIINSAWICGWEILSGWVYVFFHQSPIILLLIVVVSMWVGFAFFPRNNWFGNYNLNFFEWVLWWPLAFVYWGFLNGVSLGLKSAGISVPIPNVQGVGLYDGLVYNLGLDVNSDAYKVFLVWFLGGFVGWLYARFRL
ncbi:toll/interleukin-1 receptor domain-containing protein [Nostoc parmelioides]|uniref:ADP-ribosyl cyclase/cyclic ADP-ribose hydrolase n=1 Tax=Nostoc parmelioides FACHB-3921 TaxID=2692909 RepID=A0ABR8B918_9NOSO|nr:toll/interleukin-1 receptor domain-containing protein [Nostoc parmelioides]MBD2250323.1 toll/interleukin-1 receptor domain-containing protein [Nostoc parmelioides FACHB-3921]